MVISGEANGLDLAGIAALKDITFKNHWYSTWYLLGQF